MQQTGNEDLSDNVKNKGIQAVYTQVHTIDRQMPVYIYQETIIWTSRQVHA